MKRIITCTFLVILLIALLSIPVAGEAKWWDKLGKPEYGGTIIHRTDQLVSINIDPYPPGFLHKQRFFFEYLFQPDWALDRDIYPYFTAWIPPEYYTSGLAESWEQTDPLKITIKVRKGARWQDKPPVNGREFTAEDVKYNFDRMLGMGSGFKVPSPMYANAYSNVEGVDVLDKYTAVINLKKPSAMFIDTLLSNAFQMVAREWVELGPPPADAPPAGPPKGEPPKGGPPKGGPPGGAPVGEMSPLEDWKNAVGTGPWILTEFQRGSSITFTRNPKYWANDERYPENQLPYADFLRDLAIPDWATTMAAMRTGKIDIIADRNGPSWQQVETIKKTNPDIQVAWWPQDGWSLLLKFGAKPFTDIRVRKALQVSIDRQTIAKSHFGGYVKGIPEGPMSASFAGWALPFDKWPAELQAEYSYNPEKAKQLLSEAGYPNGFKTDCVLPSDFDVELLQIIKSYFMDIGVDLEIKTMEFPAWIALAMEGKFDQMTMAQHCGMTGTPMNNLGSYVTGNRFNHGLINDPEYNELYEKINSATNIDDAKKLVIEADQYALKQHYKIHTCPHVASCLWQPWLKGYSGEYIAGPAHYYARMWVDQKLKKTMGY